MTDLENRQKAFENKFAHDEETKFKISARRRKLLGLWAAETMGMNEENSLDYALNIVKLGIEDQKSGAVIDKIFNDLKSANKDISLEAVKNKNFEFEETAKKQILSK